MVSFVAFAAKGRAGFFDLVTAITAIAISLGLIVFIAWLASMVAGPAVLIKLRNRPNTLGVWTTIVLPLSIAFAFACCVAFPVAQGRACTKFYAAVPLAAAPFYIFGEPGTGFPAYMSYQAIKDCGPSG